MSTWILVAESSRAKLFSRMSLSEPIKELEAFSHPEGRLPERELVSDNDGFDGGSVGQSHHVMQKKVSAKDVEAEKFARLLTDRLDAVGNTTKALTKGYAMVSAGLAAFLLFQAYLDRVSFIKHGEVGLYDIVNIAKIEVFVGALLAGMIVYLFSAWSIKAVGKTASKIIEEVRRQFRADPEILNPKDPEHPHQPDYGKAVDIRLPGNSINSVRRILVFLAVIWIGTGSCVDYRVRLRLFEKFF